MRTALLGNGEIKAGETHYVDLRGGELVSDFMPYPAFMRSATAAGAVIGRS